MLVRNTWIQSQDEKGIEIEISPAACCFLNMSALRGSFSPANGCSLSRNNKNLQRSEIPPKGLEPSKVLNPPDQQNKLLFTLLSPYVPITIPIHPPPFLSLLHPLSPPPPHMYICPETFAFSSVSDNGLSVVGMSLYHGIPRHEKKERKKPLLPNQPFLPN